MSKKIAIALAALMLLLVALPVGAVIQATSVEIRGTVANQTAISGGFNLTNNSVDSIINFCAAGNCSTANLTDAPIWTPQTFAGFYYDLKDNLGQERLEIVDVSTRTIPQDRLQYTTRADPKSLKVFENGKATSASTNGLEKFGAGDMGVGFGQYSIVGWQAEPYVGIKNRTYKLAKLLLEQGNATSEKKSLTVGESWDIGGGWSMTANSIDAKASPRQVWLTLSKDGVKKDDKVVAQGAVYTYVEKSIGGESDVPLFVTYIDSIFAGATTDMAQFRYTWAVDTSVTEIKGGDKFGVFKVQSIDPIKLNNTDNTITLSKDTVVDLMGNMKFRVADNDNVRIYPMAIRTTPGTYEVRGTVASSTPATGQLFSNNASWNPKNFAGFYYDLKDDLGAEQLIIFNIGTRTVAQNDLIYSSRGQGKTLKAVENGKATSGATNGLEKFAAGDMGGSFGQYDIVGWQAQPYIGIKNRTYKLAKLLLEQGNATSEKKSLTVGESWDIGGGWTMTANSIDAKASPRQAWVTLSKDGVKKDDKVVAQGAVYTYVEKSIGGESDVPLFVTYVDSIFAGATTDLVQFRYTWAVDTSITEIKGGDKFGVFKVSSIDPINLTNTDNTVTLSKDTTVDLMGEMKFRVADSDTVRFYPKVDYNIGGVVPGVTPTPGVTPGVTPKVNVTVKPTNVTVTPTTPAETTPAATTPVATTPKEPGFEAVFAIAGLLAVAYIVLRQRK